MVEFPKKKIKKANKKNCSRFFALHWLFPGRYGFVVRFENASMSSRRQFAAAR